MTPQIPAYLLAFESALRPIIAAIALGLIWIWRRVNGRARSNALRDRKRLDGGAHRLVALAQRLAATNAYFATPGSPPLMLLGLLISQLIALAGVRLSQDIARLVSAMPLSVDCGGSGLSRRRAEFSLCSGQMDACHGNSPCLPGSATSRPASLAVVVAVELAQRAAGARKAAYAWSILGIADLAVAVTMGALTSPGLPHLLALDAPNLLITSYPLVMVPTFAVPLALMLHGLVLWRLRREIASTDQPPWDVRSLA